MNKLRNIQKLCRKKMEKNIQNQLSQVLDHHFGATKYGTESQFSAICALICTQTLSKRTDSADNHTGISSTYCLLRLLQRPKVSRAKSKIIKRSTSLRAHTYPGLYVLD
ncbi:unnamed protein product [Ceratitis capitata]|uniref:(Mediterranean fruit fly) hypothetical protein n=1 Tax=Ceratitis capitata TaxID=7213 RepID=A0A811U3X2_CERCA|nr:unnamed protein product [Ceratitis capitata]